MNSWDKSDSNINTNVLGKNDLTLAKKLSAAGTDHRKFMRMIIVYADITAPLYWIAEHDTYKVGSVRNSCSFIHKGLSKPFELSDFSICEDEVPFLEHIIAYLNEMRIEYLQTKDDIVFQEIRQLLPQGYNQRYTWCANYEVLANIYKSRKNHRLPEWRDFCKWIETLPYSEIITGKRKKKEGDHL